MILPPITKKQEEQLDYLLKFRFLTTNHFQKLQNHKNPNGVLEWLRDLREKGYITMDYDRKKFGDNTKPASYSLSLLARHHFKKNKENDLKVLNKIYREKKRSKKFIDQCQFLADVYLFFLSQKEEDETLHFFTEHELLSFDFFPDPLPKAYIAVETKESTRRYFLEYFDSYTPAWAMRERVKTYLRYADEGSWEVNTNNEPFPAVLFISSSENAKKHIIHYAKALLDKHYDDKLAFFITTRNTILYGKTKNIWQEIKD